MWGYPSGYAKGLLGRGEVLGIEGRGQLQLTSTQTTHGCPIVHEGWIGYRVEVDYSPMSQTVRLALVLPIA